MSREFFLGNDFTVTMLPEEAIIRARIANKVQGVIFSYVSEAPEVLLLPGHVVGRTWAESEEALASFNAKLQKIIGVIPLARKRIADSG